MRRASEVLRALDVRTLQTSQQWENVVLADYPLKLPTLDISSKLNCLRTLQTLQQWENVVLADYPLKLDPHWTSQVS